MSWRRARAAKAAISAGGIVTPLGLPGVTSTIARVRGVTSGSASAARGTRPASGLEVHRPDTAHPQPHVVVEVVGQRRDDLVARAGERSSDEAERLVAAGGHDHVRRLDRARVVARQLVGDRSAQRRDAGYGCVPGSVRGRRDLDDPFDDLRGRRPRRGRLGRGRAAGARRRRRRRRAPRGAPALHPSVSRCRQPSSGRVAPLRPSSRELPGRRQSRYTRGRRSAERDLDVVRRRRRALGDRVRPTRRRVSEWSPVR